MPQEIRGLHSWSKAAYPARAADFEGLAAFAVFIGCPGNGQSLIAAMLDAHASVLLAQDLDLLKFLDHGFDEDQLKLLIELNARAMAAIGRRWGAYDYAIPGQWQGRCDELRLIGDKKGGLTSFRIAKDRRDFIRLKQAISLPLKFLHVVRDPFDN